MPRKRPPPRVDPDAVPLSRPWAGWVPPAAAGGNPPAGPPHAPRDMPTDFPEPPRPPDQSRARAALAELARRRNEALRLYEPNATQQAFHAERCLIRLFLGGNRAGKTTGAVAEVARAVTDQDPYHKWPKSDGNFIIVGKDGSHLGKVMYPRLFLPRRNFKVIRDPITGLLRAFRPWLPEDAARECEAKPAPPLIPPRFVKEKSWYSKKDNIPRVIRLINGWELYFYSSESDPPGGYPADGAWFDEEIIRGGEWSEEVMARLVDRQGRLIWSATPQNATEELFDLHHQALETAADEKPTVVEFISHIDDNKHLSDEAREAFKKRMRKRGDDTYQVRVEGKFAIEGYRVYPEYGDRHKCKRFQVPDDWTRYVIVDPGRQVCAVLILDVPPPTHPKYKHNRFLTEEIYLKDADARKFAKAVSDKLRGRIPRAYIMDDHEGRKHETGSGRMIRDQYSRALRKLKLHSLETGCNFVPGTADPEGNREAVRDWLAPPDEEGQTPILQVFDDLENFDREMRNYHFKRELGILTDKVVKKHDHLCDDLGYAAGMSLGWKKPPAVRDRTGQGVLKRLAWVRRRQGKSKGRYVNMGNGGM